MDKPSPEMKSNESVSENRPASGSEHTPKELFNMVCESLKMSVKELEEYAKKHGVSPMALLEWRKSFTNPFKLMNKIIQEQATARAGGQNVETANKRSESAPTAYLRRKLEDAWDGKQKN